jgi:hypothetical protein
VPPLFPIHAMLIFHDRGISGRIASFSLFCQHLSPPIVDGPMIAASNTTASMANSTSLNLRSSTALNVRTFQLCPISRDFETPYTPRYASVPTDGSPEPYRSGIMAKRRQNSGSLTKTIDRLEWVREQMLTLQRALERMELDKRGRQIPGPSTRLKIKQF